MPERVFCQDSSSFESVEAALDFLGYRGDQSLIYLFLKFVEEIVPDEQRDDGSWDQEAMREHRAAALSMSGGILPPV